jgi:hypothetical protein
LALFLETSTDGQTPFAAVRDQAHALLASARLQQLFCRHLAGDGSLDYAHGGRFRARSQHEQEVWNEGSRLVGNAVVYINALMLSEALAELASRSELASEEIIKRFSPVAWQHINFYGR